MKNTKRLVLAGIVTFVLGLIITFPARVAYQWFAPAELKLNGISGSVWRGTAAQGSAGGIYLSDIHWSFRPLGLLSGNLEYASSSKLASGFIDVNVAVGVGGTLTLSDVSGALTLDTLADLLPLTGIEGDISLQLEEIVVKDGIPVDATGTVKVANLISRYLSPTPLGDYEANFATEADAITGSIDAVSGVLDLIGTVRLTPDRNYQFTGEVAAKSNAPVNVAQQLQLLGSPNADGRREFRIEGQL